MVAKRCARLTALDVPAESLGAAGLNRAQGANLHRHEAVCCLIRRTVTREDVRQFYPDSCRIRLLRMRAHGALGARRRRRLQQIER